MSEEKQMNRLVKEYLKEVRDKLPEWLKEKKEDQEILDDLEAHIWDKAEDLSNSGSLTIESVQQAIKSMGTPTNITREYKKRGTPKIYITEELWPYYKTSIKVVVILIIVGSVISIVLNAIYGNIEGILGSFNIFSVIGLGLIIVTLIFVGLSMEGFLPEDFKSKSKLNKEKEDLEKAKKEGLPISPKTGKPLKPIVKSDEKIAGGIFNLIFGFLFVLQPIFVLNDLIDPEFLIVIKYAGIFVLLDGIITLTRGTLGNEKITGQQITLVLMALLKFASIYLFVLILNNIAHFPIIYIVDGTLKGTTLSEPYLSAFANLWILIIIVQIISGIYDIYKSGSLEKYKLLK